MIRVARCRQALRPMRVGAARLPSSAGRGLFQAHSGQGQPLQSPLFEAR
ncbi:hypothetical protein P3T23_005014 [Paraburkholderia sp. GAS448]